MTNYSNEFSPRFTPSGEFYTATDEKAFSILKQIGVSGKRVLDFGCGDGRYTLRIAELGASEVVGMDVNPGKIQIANRGLQNKKIENISFLGADGNSLPFSDNYYGVVFSNFVLQHFEDTLKPLQEISRVLDKKGFFLGTFNTSEVSDKKLIKKQIPLRLGKESFVEVHKLFKSDEEMQQSFHLAGLKVLQYSEVENLFLSMLTYSNEDKVSRMKTMICLAQKI